MGFSLSWLAVKGVSFGNILEQLSLQTTGEHHQHPYGMFSAGLLDDWCLIVIERCEHKFVRKEMLKELSVGREVVAVSLEEHVMFSAAEFWSDGEKQWFVRHTGELGRNGKAWLAEGGSLPVDYADIKARLMKEQEETEDDVDYIFDLPLLLAASLTGFKHDGGVGGKEVEFEVLKRLKRRSWLHRLFAGV